MTTIVLTTNLLFGQRPRGEMHLSALETGAPEALDGIGGMYAPREDVEPDERPPHAPDHHHHRPHARKTDHHHRPHEHETAPARSRPRTEPGPHHHRPFDRMAGHHHRPHVKEAADAFLTPHDRRLTDTPQEKEPAARHGSRPVRNRNPANIEYGHFARAHGAIGTDGRFAIFPDEATGRAAQRALWNTGGYSNVPIGRALSRWGTGPLPGVDSSKRWSELSPDQQQALLDAQSRQEGWSGDESTGTGNLTPEHHGRYRGELEIGGDTFPFVSGGRGAGSSPPGDRLITGQSFGGRLGGGEGRFATSDVYDPQAGRTRSLVRIHASSSSDIDRAVSSGCFAVDRSQWPRLKQELNAELAAHGGRMMMHVGEDGNAQIYPVGGGAGQAKTYSPRQPKNLADVAEKMVNLKDHDPEGRRKLSKYLGVDPATTDWCAAFLDATARHAGLPVPPNANVALSWLDYGTPVRPEDVRRGDVVVGNMMHRKAGALGGHVAIATGPMRDGKIEVVEGDQRVDLSSYARNPGSQHSTVKTGPAYEGPHQVGKIAIPANDPGWVYRRPPDTTREAKK
jgi:hypothetical protein